MWKTQILNFLELICLNKPLIFGLYPISVYIPFGYFIFMTVITLLFTSAVKKYSGLLALQLFKLLGVLTCVFTIFLLPLPLYSLFTFKFETFTTFAGLFKFSYSIFLMQAIVLIVGAVALYIVNNYFFLYKQYHLEPNFLILSIIFGALCTLAANDLLSFFVSVELQTVPLILLISFAPYNLKAVDAGIKYFVISAMSSSLLLFGLALWYYVFGVTNFDYIGNFFYMINYYNLNLNTKLPASYMLLAIIAVMVIILSIIIKLASAPFHYWVIDIYNYTALSSILIFSFIPKFPLTLILADLLVNVFNYDLFYSIAFNLILIIGLLSVIIGTLGAFSQTKLTTILAFGSVSHIGFILMGMLCTKNLTIFITMMYLLTYSINTLLFFNGWLNLTFDLAAVKHTRILTGLAHKDLITSLILTVALFSFAGLPPTIGFSAKLLVFIGLINNNMVISACFLFLLSLISNVYYLRIIKLIWFDNATDKFVIKSLKVNSNIIIMLLNLLLVTLIIFGSVFGYCYMYF